MPTETDALINSFTNKLEATIDALVAQRLEAAFARLGVQVVVRTRPTPMATPARPIKPATRTATPRRTSRPPVRKSRPAVPAPLVPPVAAVALPERRQATVIPSTVKITRLPPGPMPGRTRSISVERTQCRVPGCLERNSGPRYDFFCRDHYAKLNRDDREKMKTMWKRAHSSTP